MNFLSTRYIANRIKGRNFKSKNLEFMLKRFEWGFAGCVSGDFFINC